MNPALGTIPKLGLNPELLMIVVAAVSIIGIGFEVTVSAVQAAAAGASLAVTQEGSTREYFGTKAFYFNPSDIGGMADAMKLAWNDSAGPSNFILENYEWSLIANKTKDAYNAMLNTHMHKEAKL